MQKLFSIVTHFGSAAVIILTLMTGTDILGRYLFNSPLPGTFDLTGNFLTIIAACGIAVTTAAEDHISVDSLYSIVSSNWQRKLRFLSYFLEIIIFSILCWQSVVAFYHSITPYLEESPGTPAFAIFPYRFALALGFFLSLIASVYSIARLFRSISGCQSDLKNDFTERT